MKQPKTYSTEQAAKMAGIHRITLLKWLQDGRFKGPEGMQIGRGRVIRRWTEKDVARLKRFKDKCYWHKVEGGD